MQKMDTYSYIHNLYLLKSIGYDYINTDKLLFVEDKYTNISNLALLKDTIINCNLCSISKYCNNRIFGYGNTNSKIVFLREKAFKDDKIFKYFIRMIKNELNLEIEDVYILNILKCDTDSISDYMEEINTCKEYTIKQIDLLNPKIIVSLGDAYKYLIKKENIDKGSILKYNNIDLCISDDPDTILRNPSITSEVIDYFKKIKNEVEKI
jgi:uracil-DNA glycosylase family 4